MKKKDVQLEDLINKEPCGCCVGLAMIFIVAAIALTGWASILGSA